MRSWAPWVCQGEMKANFLRHEGYLGAVGAFLSVHPMAGAPTAAPAAPSPAAATEQDPRQVGALCPQASAPPWERRVPGKPECAGPDSYSHVPSVQDILSIADVLLASLQKILLRYIKSPVPDPISNIFHPLPAREAD